MYNTGRGVPRNDVQAVHWYRMAADQGTAEAQLALGLMYLGVRYVKHVKGVVHVGVRSMKRELATEDVVEAVRWFRMAAERGVAEAQAILGIMYAEGQGMPQEMHKHMLGSTLPPLKATRMLRKTRRSSLNL